MQKQSTSAPSPIRFAIVGPGKVGLSLVRRLTQAGHRMERFSARRGNALGIPELPGERGLPLDELSTADLDLLLITVSDPAIEDVARRLAQRPQAAVALHTAGRFDHAVLEPLRSAGCAIGSLHPLRAFPRPLDLQALAPTWFAIDGDPAALALAKRLVDLCGGGYSEISGRSRAAYHLAATLAAGGVVTLMAVVEELIDAAGLPPEVLDGYLGLTRGALDPLERGERPAASRITGPAARGDHQALADQRRLLAELTPHLLPLITRLQDESLRQCRPPSAAAPEIPAPSKGKTE